MRAGGGRVIGRACAEQRDDFAAAAAGALNNGVDLFLAGKAHRDQVWHRNAGHCRVSDHRNHRVAMAAKDKAGHVLYRHVEFIGKEMAEAAGIEHTRHADNHVVRQAGKFAQSPDHRVERVGDANDECVRRIGRDAFANGLHHLQIDAEQIVAAHAGLARHASGDDDDVCACDIGIIVAAGDCRVKAFNRCALRQVERFALRHAFDDVEQHNVAKAF